ncbi:hypothetical protein IWW42_001041 [Coemansia sp. RSA 1085]|nr:hypothetical protein IWW42_001041 [Coemansia sp. RSA 1085]
MSGVTLFSSAWEAQSEAHIYGYAIQALNPGLIKCAALGNRLSQNPHTSTEMLVVVDSSLVLFAINGPEMEMQRICDAPVFSKVLDIVFSGNSGDSDGVYIVLSSDGQLVLVDSEAIGDRRRLRVIERYSVLTQEEDGLAIRLLRKLVADPLARCVAAVSWIDFIEVSMLVWSTGQSRYPQIRNERIQISTGEAICDAAILMPSPTETQRILLLAAVMDGEKQSYFLHLYEIWTISTASHMAFSLVAKLPLPLDLATPLHIIPLPQFPEHFILITETESAELSLIPIMSAVDNQVFTHGACLASESRIWVALAIQPRSLSTSRTTLVRVASVTPSHTANISSEQWEFAEVFVEADVSCVRLFVIGASIVLAIGTYAPELRLYRLEAESTAVPKVTPIHFDMPLAFTQDSCEQMSDSMSIGSRAGPAVSDICILHEPSVSYVLVGLRDGHLSWKSLHTGCLTDAGDYTCVGAAISDPRVVKVGKVPVSFATDSVQFESILPGAVVCSSSLYLAKIGELCQLNITPCQGPYTLYASIHCIAPLLAENAANSGPRSCANDDESIGARSQTQRFFATYTDGRVGTLEIDFFAECSISTYSVKAEPKRLVVDQNTGLLLVACKAPVSLDPEVSGWTSELKAVDPRTGWIHDKVQFRAMELVCSLATWNIRGPKTYRYLCVGTTQFAEDMRSTGGRLVIYSIKQTKRKSRTKRAGSSLELMGYELKYVWESDRRGPVSALASLGDSYLVVAVGSSCLVLKLDVVQKRLIECCECRLRFAATSLDVRGYDIVVGSQRESVNVLRFTPSVDPNGCDQLVLMHSARFGGHTVDARFIADDLVAGIDHNGFLYVVGIPKHSTEFALDYVLGMHLQTECTRMQVGRLIQKPSQPQHALSWSTGHSTSCLPDADHLVVSTLSGALWTLLRISEVAYEVLRKLEQTMLKMPVLHPAFPLVPSSEGLVNRAGKGSRIQPAGTIDGTYLTIFASQLTRDEQIEVVSSSPDLTRAALSLDPESNSASAAIARLLYTLNHTCIC